LIVLFRLLKEELGTDKSNAKTTNRNTACNELFFLVARGVV
jgi:hypothetical protein